MSYMGAQIDEGFVVTGAIEEIGFEPTEQAP